jgi:HEPN domain-containing protein
MKSLTKEWVGKAEADYAVVQKLRKARPPFHDIVCFHCQQAAEKYLKAYLQEQGLPVPRIHDLVDLLLLLVPSDSKLKVLRRAARSLSQFAVDIRYPGIRASARKAQAAERQCTTVRAEIRKRLGIRDRPSAKR